MESIHETQREIWDEIAPEWSKFRSEPYKKVLRFLDNLNKYNRNNKDNKNKRFTERKSGGINIGDFGGGSGRHLISDWNNLKEGKNFKEGKRDSIINIDGIGSIINKGSRIIRSNKVNKSKVINSNSKIEKNWYVVDFSKEMIALAKKRAKKLGIKAKFYVNDLEKMPFTDNFFDVGIFVAVLQCIPGEEKRKKVVEELFRVMKPNGEMFVSVWNKDSSWFRNKPKEKFIDWRDKGKRYYYLYDEKEIHDLFKEIGFKIKRKFIPEKNISFVVEKTAKFINKDALF